MQEGADVATRIFFSEFNLELLTFGLLDRFRYSFLEAEKSCMARAKRRMHTLS